MTAMGATPLQQAASSPEPWWRGAVIYQVYPRSYCDSDGDGVGDLNGITQRLGHIASLGADAIWLSPFFKSPMADFGYDVSDYCQVDPLFGTLEDFDRLIEKTHQLGMKLIIDQVFSHTSDEHDWFKESRKARTGPRADWYVWAAPKPDGTPPNNWQSVFGGPAWTWDARRGQYYLHNFLSSQPQLNLHRPDVQAAIMDIMRFWLKRGVDGYRLDAVSFMMHDPQLRDNPPREGNDRARTRSFDFQKHLYNQSQPGIVDFLKRLRAVGDEYGASFMVAEVDREHSDAEMKAFTRGDDTLQSAYGFTFLYADTLTPQLVRQAMEEWPGNPGEGWPSWTFSNHDAPRAISRWAKGRDPKAFADMAVMLLTSLRGNIFLYQGEELGLPQADVPFERLQDPEAIANWPLTLGRDGARTPLPWSSTELNAGFGPSEPWLPVCDDHVGLSVDCQDKAPNSTLNRTRRAIDLRKQFAALRTGKIEFVASSEDLLVFTRGSGADAILCAFNLGHATAHYALPEGWHVVESINGAKPDSGTLQPLEGYLASRSPA